MTAGMVALIRERPLPPAAQVLVIFRLSVAIR